MNSWGHNTSNRTGATNPGDYTAVGNTTVTFLPGETSKTVAVNITNDGTTENNLENFNLNLVSATNAAITLSLGIALLLTAVAILFRKPLVDWSHRNDVIFTRMSDKQRHIASVFIGIGLGVIVTITSIGAGALGTMALFLIYPLLRTSKLIGTEIAHAVPLTLIAGLGHASMGNVNFNLLLNLLIGSLPGIWIGSHLAGTVPDKYVRPALSVMLVYAGIKLILK